MSESTARRGRSPLPATLVFSLALTLVFTLVTYILPQVEGEAPKETEFKLGELTMDDFVALGQELFEGKGTCTLCHKPPPLGRAPDNQGLNMTETAKERLADERYQGDAGESVAYIRESLVDPSKYVVAGWGQKGSNDTVYPMPAVDKPPIQLSAVETDAIIAYLQAKDGNEVTVALPTESPVLAQQETAAPTGAPPAQAQTGAEAVAKYACQACHSMLGTESVVGPPLTDVGARLSPEQIRQSILEPNAEISEGFAEGIMPGDFAEKMTVMELQMLVDLLSESRG